MLAAFRAARGQSGRTPLTRYALNQADKFLLAIVLVRPDDSRSHTIDGPFYIRHPFDSEPGWGVSSINFEIKALLQRGQVPW